MPSVVRAFGERAFDSQSAYCVDGFRGAALWLAPGAEPDGERLASLFEEHAPADVVPDLMRVFEQMGQFHPHEPHWYLPLIGVDPACQGQGHGAALMRHALERSDRDGVPAYLESSNPRNISLYLRHGFEIMGDDSGRRLSADGPDGPQAAMTPIVTCSSRPPTSTRSSKSTPSRSCARGPARCTKPSFAIPSVTRIFLVRTGEHVAGYCATWFLPGELHINNLAIRPACRRQRLASVLLASVLEAARAAGCQRATLEVRRSNHAARQLYEGLGFRLAGVRHDYYTDPVEDALILWRDPAESSSAGQNG